MSNPCLETKCYQCCKETNMLLSYQDIETIEKKGYEKSFFVKEHDGWLELKNANGRCVFHNGDKCTLYENRPQGCRLYPVVYETDSKSAIIDSECPQKQYFPRSKSKEQQLLALISILQNERRQRQK
jgi:uncharacterized protein